METAPNNIQGVLPSSVNRETPCLNNMDNSRKAPLVNGESQRSPQEIDIRGRPSAISVQNANKGYSNGVPVLKNFNMTVPQGTIYGLLGASGCGKTTMLSCIVGIRHLDSGDIFVFGQRPGTPESGIPGRRVGYMPQDIALYQSMSIKEQLQYYGRIYGMSHSEIIGRIEFLTNFLDLPPASQRIGTLSGGQQRRTSLAACLLHEPSLLILDEPTVGVDPLLRENIWEYLCDLVAKKHTTVIITTHYIEEARQSHTTMELIVPMPKLFFWAKQGRMLFNYHLAVGMMRNGRLLVEKAPDVLLREHNTTLLEDIVLKLCKNDTTSFGENAEDEVAQTLQETSFYSRNKLMPQKKNGDKNRNSEDSVVGLTFKKAQIDENQNSKTDGRPQNPKVFTRQQSFRDQARDSVWTKFSRVRAVTIRNTLNLLRNPLFMLAIFFMPSFQVIMVNLTVGPEPKNMKFGVVNPEVNFDVGLCANVSKGCKLENLSCRYINSLPSSVIIPVSKSSIEDALRDVRSGKLWGYMSFPQNYSQHAIDRIVAGNFAENVSIAESTIDFRMDSSHYFAGVLLTKTFYESFQAFAKDMLGQCGHEERRADLPLNFRKPIYGTFDVTFQEYISPGVLIIIIFFIPYISCAVANITDRKQGTLDRSMVAGATTTDIMMAFFITEGFLIVVQTLISFCVVIFVFQWEIKGSVAAYLSITILTGVAGLSFGFLIAQLCTEEMEALIVGIGCYLPNLILSGIIWPLEATSPILRAVAYCLPCTWSINAIRSVISRGWPVTHKYVWPGFGVLMVWITLTWLLAIRLWRARS